MKENKNETLKSNVSEVDTNQKKPIGLIVTLIIIVILILAGGSIFTIYNFKIDASDKLKAEQEETNDEAELAEEPDTDADKDKDPVDDYTTEVKILSEDKLNKKVYELKDKVYMSGIEDGAVVYIDEGVFELELTKGNYAYVHIFDVLSDVRLTVNLFKAEKFNELKKVSEIYLYPGMYIKVDDENIPNELKNGEDIEVALRRLDKTLDQVTSKTGKTYELTEKPEGEFYLVGKDIEVGLYDVELVEGAGGKVYIEYKDETTKAVIGLYIDEKLFKDFKLNEGDRLFFLPMSAPGIPEVAPKYRLTAN